MSQLRQRLSQYWNNIQGNLFTGGINTAIRTPKRFEGILLFPLERESEKLAIK